MSGSIKWMIYTADDTNQYAVKIDESNGEALGFDDYTGETLVPLPRGYRMRGINVLNAAGQKRFFPVGKPDEVHYNGTDNTVNLNGSDWRVTSTRGERRVVPGAFDTGLDDGDDS